MKKLLFGLSVCFATVLSAQNYPSNNGWGNNSSSYSSYDDQYSDYYFPDDYYYEYPDDYYADDFYRGYYDDYRQSLQIINWNRFFRENNLSRRQISMILDLNNQFNNFNVWNSYYRSNPQRWYYDRYFALERILGPSVYIVFQNNYYNGYNPVIYYHNRWDNYYRPSYYIRPAYVNININYYKVNRQQYHQSVGNNYGWNQPRNVSNGFKEDNNRIGSYRNNQAAENGFKNAGNRNSSLENGSRSTSIRSTNAVQNSTQPPRTRSTAVESTAINAVQVPGTREVRSVEPRRSTSVISSNSNAVRSERSSSVRSSGGEQRSSSPSAQRSSSTGTRGGR